MLINEVDTRRDAEEKYIAIMDRLGVKVIGETIDSECKTVTQIDTKIHINYIERIYSDGSSEKGNYVNGEWIKDEEQAES